jgi:hypothetical protein
MSTFEDSRNISNSDDDWDMDDFFDQISVSTQTKTASGVRMPQSNYPGVEDLIYSGALDAQQTYDDSLQGNDGPKPGADLESDTECAQDRRPKSRARQKGTTPLFTTPSGHKRGPLNGGRFFSNKRPLPDLIPEFRPKPYIGPVASVKGQQSAINTQGKKVAYNIYTTIADTHPNFVRGLGYDFAYDSRGRLAEHVLFDRESFAAFITYHPLGKNLCFRLEKFPANCKGFGVFSGDHSTYNKCRAKECPSKEKGGHGFHDGTIRVAIEEVLGRLPRGQRFDNNPYFCAGYLHIDCLENLMDIGQLIRAGMLRPKPREFHPKEPHTSKTEPQILCPPAKLVTCFEEFCKRVLQLQWDGYLHNLADRLQTYVWLSVQKKGKWSTHDAPSDMRKEDAKELLKRRPVDPNWGGGRRPGLAMNIVKKAEAAGKRHQLVGPGTGRNSEKAVETAQKIIEEIEVVIPEDAFETGEAWLRDCYIPLTNLELYLQDDSSTTPEAAPAQRQTMNLTPSRTRCSLLSRNQARSRSSPRGSPQGKASKKRTRADIETPSVAEYIIEGSTTPGINVGEGTVKRQKQMHMDTDDVTFFDSTILDLTNSQAELSNSLSSQNALFSTYPPRFSPALQPQFSEFSPSQSHPQFLLSPNSQQLFFPPIQSPTSLNSEKQVTQRLQTPSTQSFGFDFSALEAQSCSFDAIQNWKGELPSPSIDPFLLSLLPFNDASQVFSPASLLEPVGEGREEEDEGGSTLNI